MQPIAADRFVPECREYACLPGLHGIATATVSQIRFIFAACWPRLASMDKDPGYHEARALLEWQFELGVDEAICEAPVNRYELLPKAPKTAPKTPIPVRADPQVAVDPVQEAQRLAAGADTLARLNETLAAFPHCELKKGARSTVFADGSPAARVMVIGEAPGRDEDLQGKPFVGRAGQLLDRMFEAIGMSRLATEVERALYITNILPWRPPRNRDPEPVEIGMILPFVHRHIELASPEILILMGNISCQALLGRRGITRLRGNWNVVLDLPALPMFHPAYLLRNPRAKREAWADLLTLQARLEA